MPGRGIMRAKQKRAGGLGQSSRFCSLCPIVKPNKKDPCEREFIYEKFPCGQGFGNVTPSIGSMRSLATIKQNRVSEEKRECKNYNSCS